MARSRAIEALTILRLSDAVISGQTSTSTVDLIRQFLSLSQKQDLAYDISGVLYSKDGRLPFKNSGVLLEQERHSGKSSAQ